MGKRGLYILPLYPAAAILVAGFFRERREGKWFSIPVKIVAIIYGLLGLLLVAKGSLSFPGTSSVSLTLPGVFCMAVALWILFQRNRPIAPIVVGQLLLFIVIGYWATPIINQNNSIRSFVQKNMTFLTDNSKVAIAQYRSANVFYGDRNLVEFPGISESDNIAAFVSYLEETPDSFGILSRKWTTRLKQMGIAVEVLNERRVGNKQLCFIRIQK